MWKELICVFLLVCLVQVQSSSFLDKLGKRTNDQTTSEDVVEDDSDVLTDQIRQELNDMHAEGKIMKATFFRLTGTIIHASYVDKHPNWDVIIKSVLGYIAGCGEYLVHKFSTFLGPWAPEHMKDPDIVEHFKAYSYKGNCHYVHDFVQERNYDAEKWVFALMEDVFCLGHFQSELFALDISEGMSEHDYQEFMATLTEDTMDLYWDGALCYTSSLQFWSDYAKQQNRKSLPTTNDKDLLLQSLRSLLGELKAKPRIK